MCILLHHTGVGDEKESRGLVMMCILQHHTYGDVICGWPSCSAAKYGRIPGVAEHSHRMVAVPPRIHMIWDQRGMHAHICKPFILPRQFERWLAMAIRTVSCPKLRWTLCLYSRVISDGNQHHHDSAWALMQLNYLKTVDKEQTTNLPPFLLCISLGYSC